MGTLPKATLAKIGGHTVNNSTMEINVLKMTLKNRRDADR